MVASSKAMRLRVLYTFYRRKKKCIRYSVDDDDHTSKDTPSEVEDEVILTSNMTKTSVMLSQAASEGDQCNVKDHPHHMLHHSVPVTLQTVPT